MDDGGIHWRTITDPFEHTVDNVFDYLPRVVGVLALILIAWIRPKSSAGWYEGR